MERINPRNKGIPNSAGCIMLMEPRASPQLRSAGREWMELSEIEILWARNCGMGCLPERGKSHVSFHLVKKLKEGRLAEVLIGKLLRFPFVSPVVL